VRELDRAQRNAEKASIREHFESRLREAEEANREVTQTLDELSKILAHTLAVEDTIAFDDLRLREPFPPPVIPDELTKPPTAPQKETFIGTVKAPGFLGRLIPGSGARHENELRKANATYAEAVQRHEAVTQSRDVKLRDIHETYEKEQLEHLERVRQRDREVDEFRSAYERGESQAISSYCTMVLERSEHPDGFPQDFLVAYIGDSRELVIEYQMPTVEIIPSVSEFRYVKSRDSIEEKQRRPNQVRELYLDVVASVCLRSIHEVFEADQHSHLASVVFNGFIHGIDPATGRDAHVHFISVRAPRDPFLAINLARVDMESCLRNLGARISSKPEALQTVLPFVHLDTEEEGEGEES